MIPEGITFDEYSDKICEADALSFKTAPLGGHWYFARHLLHQTTLQFGSGGSGTIVHGTTRSTAYFFFRQSAKRADRIVFNGRVVKWPEIVVIPPASHFTFTSTGLAQWISFLVPTQLANGITTVASRKTLLFPPATEFVTFIDAAMMARKRMQLARPRRKINLQKIETELLTKLDSIVSNTASEISNFDERTEKVMSKILDYLRLDNQIHVLALAQAAGVSERTLHRVFKKYFHMGPKRYLKIRQLNLVSRAIRQNHSAPVSVTGILTEHGVTEFGRFAIEYKALFHESPAETLQKYLVRRSDGVRASLRQASKHLGK